MSIVEAAFNATASERLSTTMPTAFPDRPITPLISCSGSIRPLIADSPVGPRSPACAKGIGQRGHEGISTQLSSESSSVAICDGAGRRTASIRTNARCAWRLGNSVRKQTDCILGLENVLCRERTSTAATVRPMRGAAKRVAAVPFLRTANCADVTAREGNAGEFVLRGRVSRRPETSTNGRNLGPRKQRTKILFASLGNSRIFTLR